MKTKELLLFTLFTSALFGCGTAQKEYESFKDYPTFTQPWDEMTYSETETDFMLWAPTAEEVNVKLYTDGLTGDAIQTVRMKEAGNGTWKASVTEDLKGKFYTFQVKINGIWLDETPGVMAKAVGVNGKRGAILNLDTTDPEGWSQDVRPTLKGFDDIIIYEMHHRDFSIDSLSGIKNRGKFLALTESGTVSKEGQKTGIDHLKELGVTHVHLLPSYDYASVDETQLDKPQYNWGYDPLNYNAPEGSYATDPYTPETRIREFKQMVMALHQAGIRVIMDVVYNHTFNTEGSNFERTVPGYFYRQNPDGSFANGSACGNETASEREMMRKYMVESVCYWANEYHIDGFRFDLMGIHDITTMEAIRSALDKIDPTIYIYGEGWAASSPAYPADSLAMKANTYRMPGVAAFSDEFRDGLRGSWNNDLEGAFVIGRPGHDTQVMFGITAALPHPQLKDSTLHAPASWTAQPTQMLSYTSCHDDHCITDRLKITAPKATDKELTAYHKLAHTAVFTSQGVPFIFTGDEIMRDKKGVRNSYNSPDSINAINWAGKAIHREAFDYLKGLIAMRKAHPAFHLGDTELIYKHLEFLDMEDNNVVAFRINGAPNGDTWKNITVILNSKNEPASIDVPQGTYQIVCKDGKINPEKGLGSMTGNKLTAAPRSALIVHQ